MKKKIYTTCLLFCLFNLINFVNTSVIAGIWIRPLNIKQGEIVLISGLFHRFNGNISNDNNINSNISYLGDCQIKFDNKTYKFFREIVSFEEYRNSQGTNGFQFVTRLSTNPFTQTGERPIVLECPHGRETFFVNIQDGNFTIQHLQLTKEKNALTKTERETIAVNQALSTNSLYKLWDSNKAWTQPNMARISTEYGLKRTYNGKFAENYYHRGLDYAGMQDTPVIAPARGKVVLAGYEKDGFAVHGNCLFIDHGQGVISNYLHLNSIQVAEGQEVEAGQLIGKIGSTGIATGPHLHFGLYINGISINPTAWFQYAIP